MLTNACRPILFFFFSSRRRHTRCLSDWSSDVCSSDLSQPAVAFGWYQEGFDKEETDAAGPVTANGSHASYVTHHNGPQYFGYVANTPAIRSELHGLGDFFTAIQNTSLPKSGGVFYVKGG